MGNSTSQLPFSVDAQVGAPHDHNGWAFHDGKSTDGRGTEVSVFVGKKPELSKKAMNPRFPNMTQLEPALHHFNHCRKLRHPHILKVHATLDTDNPTSTSTDGGPPAPSAESTTKVTTGDLIIVTEKCVSLNQWLLQKPTPEQLAWGLECVVKGLHFLHSSAKTAHGILSPSSFYVTPAGDVKLWNFSVATAVGPQLLTNHFQKWEQACTPENYRSPERVQQRWDTVSGGGVHAIDSYALAILIDHWYQGRMPQPLVKAVQRLQTPNVKMRPRLQPLLKCPVFDTQYQKLQLQLEEVAIQPVEQKISLWQNLGTTLENGQIPKDVAVHKLLPLMQSTIGTTCTNESMLAQDLYRREVLATTQPLFYIVQNFMDPSKVSHELGPTVALLFKVKDRGVRGALLNKVGFMAKHLDSTVLNAAVFEPLCSGFNDSSPALRELTLKATLSLVPSLNAPNIEKLSRYLVRLQADAETSIRTNSVIFFSKVAPNMSEVSREKILLPAYVRAMKDSFPPCRLAALQSIRQAKDLFSVQDLAGKVLPSVIPLSLDPMTDVRQESFKVINEFLTVLKRESDRLQSITQSQPPPAIAPPAASTPTGVAPSPSSGSYLSGLSSWMSTSTQPQEATPITPAAMPPVPRPVAPAPIPAAQQQRTTTTLPISTATNLATPVDDDGWDDTEGWDEDDSPEDDPFANIGQKKPVSSGGFSAAQQQFPTPQLNDDPFAAIGMTPSPSIKLSAPPKKAGVTKLTAQATKLSISDDDLDDGWDDF